MKSLPPYRPTVSLSFGIGPRRPNIGPVHPDETAEIRRPQIVLVDRDPASRRATINRLGNSTYTVTAVGDEQAGFDCCARSRPDLVIVDQPSKEKDGLAFFRKLKSRWPQLPVIIVTAHGSISEAVKATQCGAFAYLVKPVDTQELLSQASRAVAAAAVTAAREGRPADIVARSQLLQERLAMANRAAGGDESILLTGEQDIGKELMARAIHAASARRANAFVVVSCRKTPPETLESALFGDACGGSAETEPHQSGAWQRARSGTLLVDGIDHMPLAAQAMLLEALAKDRMSRDNEARVLPPSVRVICTTSRDLKSMVGSKEFLEELRDRISILPIEIPPLGRRREDIPQLISHFLSQAANRSSKGKTQLRRPFELLQAAMIPTYKEAQDMFARDYLEQSLKRTAGNVTQSARVAKRCRANFYSLLARFRLNPDEFKMSVPR